MWRRYLNSHFKIRIFELLSIHNCYTVFFFYVNKQIRQSVYLEYRQNNLGNSEYDVWFPSWAKPFYKIFKHTKPATHLVNKETFANLLPKFKLKTFLPFIYSKIDQD